MAIELQPSSWATARVPTAGGTAYASYTSSSITFIAQPATGWHFVRWVFEPFSGNSQAPGQWQPALKQDLSRNLTSPTHTSGVYPFDPDVNPEYVNGGVKGTAYFEQDSGGSGSEVVVVTSPNPPAGGTTTGDGKYSVGASVTIRATANNGWTFKRWKSSTGATTTSEIYSFVAAANVLWTAYFERNATRLLIRSN